MGKMIHAGFTVPLLLLALSYRGEAQERFTIRPSSGHEIILFVEKTGVLAGKKHRFVFPDYAGSINYVRDHPERSSVDLSVQANSLQVTDDWIKDKDRSKIHDYALSAEMLDVKQYPALAFKSSGMAKPVDATHFSVDGMLTIHGETRPVTVMVAVIPDGKGLLVDGSASFKLSDFHLKRPSAALGTIGTKDEVLTTFKVSASPGSTP